MVNGEWSSLYLCDLLISSFAQLEICGFAICHLPFAICHLPFVIYHLLMR